MISVTGEKCHDVPTIGTTIQSAQCISVMMSVCITLFRKYFHAMCSHPFDIHAICNSNVQFAYFTIDNECGVEDSADRIVNTHTHKHTDRQRS